MIATFLRGLSGAEPSCAHKKIRHNEACESTDCQHQSCDYKRRGVPGGAQSTSYGSHDGREYTLGRAESVGRDEPYATDLL